MKSLTIVLLFACFATMFTSCVKTNIKPDTTAQTPNSTHNDPGNDGASPAVNPGTGTTTGDNGALLAGNWTLVNDSTYSTGMDASDHSTIGNYIGKDGDYFKFTADGKLFIKEGGAIDTATYVALGSNLVVNYSFYAGLPVAGTDVQTANFTRLNLTANSVKLSSTLTTATGVSSRVINLKR
jgi:hypothetical protein